MSHAHTRLIWDHTTASGNDLLVLLALADSADDAGRVSMSQPQIAAKIRADRTTVARSIEALIAAGHLEIADKASGSRAATYAICGVGLVDTVTRVIDQNGETMADAAVRVLRPYPFCTMGYEADENGALQFFSRTSEIPAGQPASTGIPAPSGAVTGAPETETVPAGEGPDDAQDAGDPAAKPAPDTPVAGGVSHHIAAGLPQSEVGAFLTALNIRPDPMQPLYWHRTQHRAVLSRTLDTLRMDARTALTIIKRDNIRAEKAMSLGVIADLLRGRK